MKVRRPRAGNRIQEIKAGIVTRDDDRDSIHFWSAIHRITDRWEGLQVLLQEAPIQRARRYDTVTWSQNIRAISSTAAQRFRRSITERFDAAPPHIRIRVQVIADIRKRARGSAGIAARPPRLRT